MEDMDKKGLIKEIAKRTDFTLKDTRIFLDALIDTFADAIESGNTIDVRGWIHVYLVEIDRTKYYVPKSKIFIDRNKKSPRIIAKISKNIKRVRKERDDIDYERDYGDLYDTEE